MEVKRFQTRGPGAGQSVERPCCFVDPFAADFRCEVGAGCAGGDPTWHGIIARVFASQLGHYRRSKAQRVTLGEGFASRAVPALSAKVDAPLRFASFGSLFARALWAGLGALRQVVPELPPLAGEPAVEPEASEGHALALVRLAGPRWGTKHTFGKHLKLGPALERVAPHGGGHGASQASRPEGPKLFGHVAYCWHKLAVYGVQRRQGVAVVLFAVLAWRWLQSGAECFDCSGCLRSGPASDARLPVACVHETLAERAVGEAVFL